MIYAMIYVGVFCVRLVTAPPPGGKPAWEFIGDLVFTFGWGTIGAAAVLAFG